MADFAPKTLTESSIPTLSSGSSRPTSSGGGGISTGAGMVIGLANIASKALPAFTAAMQGQFEKDVAGALDSAVEGKSQGTFNNATYQAELNRIYREETKGKSVDDTQTVINLFRQKTGALPPTIRQEATQATTEASWQTAGALTKPNGTPQEQIEEGRQVLLKQDRAKQAAAAMKAQGTRAAFNAKAAKAAGVGFVNETVSMISEPAMAMVRKNAALTRTGDVTGLVDSVGLMAQIQDLRITGKNTVMGQMRDAGYTDNDVMKAVVENYDMQTKTIEDMLTKSPDFAALEKQLTLMETKFGLQLAEAAPMIMAFKAVAGSSDALTGILNGLSTRADIQTRLTDEMTTAIRSVDNISGPGGKPANQTFSLKAIIGVQAEPNGANNIDNESAPEAYKAAFSAMQHLRGKPVNDRNAFAYARQTVITSNLALGRTTDPEQLGTVVREHYGTSQTLQYLGKMEPNLAGQVSRKMIAVSSKSLREDMKDRRGARVGLESSASIVTSANEPTARDQLGEIRYNANNGSFVITNREGVENPKAGLEADLQQVSRMNKALKTIVDLARFDKDLKGLSAKQIKDLYVQNNAVTTKKGGSILAAGSAFPETQKIGDDARSKVESSQDPDVAGGERVDFHVDETIQAMITFAGRGLQKMRERPKEVRKGISAKELPKIPKEMKVRKVQVN